MLSVRHIYHRNEIPKPGCVLKLITEIDTEVLINVVCSEYR